ncbi:hypothetical protein CMV_028943 [Castanea mollissima]|uniref:Uncharacterized protein n=1 Tax=Castanea mollissima TaxID=60419 RepID=A0A8J4Q774_9ROSI|nr:hypothetical protein CMV_028943 [Castanea mollissima]
MACLFSISFSIPLCAPTILFQEIYPRKSYHGRLSNQATAKTAPKLLTICNANKGILSVNWSHQHHLITPSIFPSEPSSCPLNSCTHMILAGYWVGPDLDDGWGFVEAFVNQIT